MSQMHTIEEFEKDVKGWGCEMEVPLTWFQVKAILHLRTGGDISHLRVISTEEDGVDFLVKLFRAEFNPEVLLSVKETQDGSMLLKSRVNLEDVYCWMDMAGHVIFPHKWINALGL